MVPGRTPLRAIVQPLNVLTAMTEKMTSRISGQSRRKVPTKSCETVAAIISARTTCTAKKQSFGTRIVPPESATAMPASIGPIISAAGKPVM